MEPQAPNLPHGQAESIKKLTVPKENTFLYPHTTLHKKSSLLTS